MTSVKERCCKQVLDKSGYHTYRCSLGATLTENGKPYCRIHAPSLVAKRRAERDAAYSAKRDAAWEEGGRLAAQHAEDRRRLAALPGLLYAAERAEAILAGMPEQGLQGILPALRAAIAEAKGHSSGPVDPEGGKDMTDPFLKEAMAMSIEALQVTPGKAESVWLVHEPLPEGVNPVMDYFSVLVYRYPGGWWQCQWCNRKVSALPCKHIRAVQKWLEKQEGKL